MPPAPRRRRSARAGARDRAGPCGFPPVLGARSLSPGRRQGKAMRLRIALCNEVVRGLSFGAQCDFVAACGYDGIELAPFTISSAPDTIAASEAARLRRAGADAGVVISGLHWLLV